MASKKKNEKKIEERTYTIPLRQAFRNAASYRKTNRAVKAVRDFLKKHFKSEDIRLGQHLNNFLWERGIKHPPPRVTVVGVKDEEGVVRVELSGKTYKESVKALPKEETSSLKDKLAGTFSKKKKDEASPVPTAKTVSTEKVPEIKAVEKVEERKTDQKRDKPEQKNVEEKRPELKKEEESGSKNIKSTTASSTK